MIGEIFELFTFQELIFEPTDDMLKVLGVFPNAFVFKDTHEYVNRALGGEEFGICECKYLSSDEPIMIVGDYQKSRGFIKTRGLWAASVEQAWQNAWTHVQESMLEKFKR